MQKTSCDVNFNKALGQLRKASESARKAALDCLYETTRELLKACNMFAPSQSNLGDMVELLQEGLESKDIVFIIRGVTGYIASIDRSQMDFREPSAAQYLLLAVLSLNDAFEQFVNGRLDDLDNVHSYTVRARASTSRIIEGHRRYR